MIMLSLVHACLEFTIFSYLNIVSGMKVEGITRAMFPVAI